MAYRGMKSALAVSVLMSAMLAVGTAAAQNLVTNGGFETGDMSGWTENLTAGIAFTTTGFAYSGTYAGALLNNDGAGTLSQSFNLEAGRYTLSLAALPMAAFDPRNEFRVIFDGVTMTTISGSDDPVDWTFYSWTIDVESGERMLVLEARTYPGGGTFFFDEVSLFLVFLPPVITDRQIAAELKLQAAQQGLMLSDAQSRTILNQMRMRMAAGLPDTTATASLVSAYAEEDTVSMSSFGYATPNGDVFSSGRWTAWSDTSADGFKGSWEPDARGYQARQQFGLDYRFANGWIAGVGIGGGIFDTDFDNGGSLSGSAFWVQPYAAATIGGWLVSLQAAYTYTDYDTFDTGLGLTGDTHGNRISGSVTVSRQFDLANGFYVTPEAAITAGKERISNLAILPLAPVDDPAFFNARLGGEIGYRLPTGGRIYGLAFAEYTETNGDGDASYLSTGYQADSWSATLGGGFDAAIGESARIGLEGRVRGIGSDTLVYGASARLSVSF